MKNKDKKINFIEKFLAGTVLLLSVLCVNIINNNSNIDINNYDKEINEYVLNKRTKKVHINICPAVKKMSNKNKEIVNDALSNILNNGYIVCNKCKAGRISKSSNIKNLKNIFINDEEYENLPSKEEYLQTIMNMGDWYVNHIPTYCTTLETMPLSEYIGEEKYIDDITLNYKIKGKSGIGTYKFITTKATESNIDEFDKNTIILKAKNKAIQYYQENFDKIDFKKSIAYYPCEYLSDSNGNYKKAGDDCVRFFFSCMNAVNKNFIYILSKASGEKWSHINSRLLATSNSDIQYVIKELGFEIYDQKEHDIDINNDDDSDGKIYQINNNFVLQKGDILVANDHVHFYLDDKVGIDIKNFGWGKVNYLSPQLSACDIKYFENEGYKINCNGKYFTRVYRYIGNEEE